MSLNIIHTRVGTTRSGKIIPYTQSVKDLGTIIQYFEDALFTSDDLYDAFAVFNYLALRAIRRGDETAIFYSHALRIQGALDPQELNDARTRAKVGSAFDLRDLGKSLAAVEFTDF